LLVLSSPGVASILAFKNQAAFAMKITNVDDDGREAIIETSAKIMKEVKKPKDRVKIYETTLSEDMKNNVSETLLSLLQILGITEQPAVLIGNMVTAALTKQQTLSRLLLLCY
jgi:precorrin-3B methylase